MPLMITLQLSRLRSVTATSAGTTSEAGIFRGKIPARQSDNRIALYPRPREFSSHTIMRNYRLEWCSPADSRSNYAIRLRWDLDTAHSCRPAPYNPAGSRSRFARHSRNRTVAAVDNNIEHSLGLRRQRLLRQSRHLPTQSLSSYAWQSSQLVRSLLAFQRRKVSREDRLFEKFLGIVAPELTDVGIALDCCVDELTAFFLHFANIDCAITQRLQTGPQFWISPNSPLAPWWI